MIGVIIKVLINMVEDLTDKQTLDRIYEKAGIESGKEYSINQPYADEEWQRLFNATLEVMSLTEDEAYTAYADAFVIYAEKLFPMWFTIAKSSKDFLLLQPKIHNSFSSGLVDAKSRQKVNDKFSVIEDGDDLVVNYRSPNQHCRLYMKLAHRMAARYHDTLEIKEESCMATGADKCVMRVHASFTFPTSSQRLKRFVIREPLCEMAQ